MGFASPTMGLSIFRPTSGNSMNPSHISNQEIDGERTVIPGRFKLLGKTKYTFEVGYYQPEYTLVIDPTLDYSTYLGGELGDTITGVALDADGHSYLTGITDSLDFPTTAGAFDGSLPPGNGTFITKLDAEGSNLIYSTFLGGNGRDEPGGIAVDGLGSAYVIGSTFSTDFPTTPTRFQPNHGGSLWDAFVTKLSPDGSGLVYSSYLGGDGDEFGSDIAVDIAGSAYLVGETRSSDFPTVDAFQPEFGGGFNDVFIAKVDLAGSSLVYSSYLGGSSDDELFGTSTVAVGSDGSAYVAGVTESVDFPTAGPFQAESAGGRAGFVSKVSPEGSALDYSTYIGGSGTDIIEAITVDIDGNAYFTGRTQSADFPIANPWQADLSSGNEEAFVVKLNPAGSALIYSTYLGGEGSDVGRGIALDADGMSM